MQQTSRVRAALRKKKRVGSLIERWGGLCYQPPHAVWDQDTFCPHSKIKTTRYFSGVENKVRQGCWRRTKYFIDRGHHGGGVRLVRMLSCRRAAALGNKSSNLFMPRPRKKSSTAVLTAIEPCPPAGPRQYLVATATLRTRSGGGYGLRWRVQQWMFMFA